MLAGRGHDADPERLGLVRQGWPAIRSSFGAVRSTYAWLGRGQATVDILRLDYERRMVDQNGASWNRTAAWLTSIDGIRPTA